MLQQRQALQQQTSGNPPIVGTPATPVPSGRAASMRAEWYQGQVPHPEHAERYEALLPGCTARFVGMAEAQGGHRRFQEKLSLLVLGFTQIAGVIIAGAVVLGGLYMSYQLSLQDKNVEAWVAGLAPLAVVAGIFVYDRASQRRELQGKERAERR